MQDPLASLDLSRRAFMQAATSTCFGVTALSNVNAATALVPRAKSVIYVFLSGGLSHLDSFDPKPENAEVAGPTKAISTTVDGMQIGHHFPLLARQADKLALIRSMTSHIGAHALGQYVSHTGYTPRGTTRHPGLASWVSKMSPGSNPRLPKSVVVSESPQGLGSSAGYMGARYAGLPIGDPVAGLQHSKAPHDLGLDRQEKRLAAAKFMNASFRSQNGARSVMEYDLAYDKAVTLMQSEDVTAFDISKEPEHVRKAYGDNRFGNGCLLARRLVERGVSFIEVMSGGWDHHSGLAKAFGNMTPALDRGLSTLIGDLAQRGLLDQTLVVLATEFGRTPLVNANGGRDHFPTVYSQLMAGGGVTGGTVYGASDERGAEVADKRVRIIDFNATIGYALGIDPKEIITSPNGRPFTMGNKGRPIIELFS